VGFVEKTIMDVEGWSMCCVYSTYACTFVNTSICIPVYVCAHVYMYLEVFVAWARGGEVH